MDNRTSEFAGISVWERFDGDKIPGSTRVPVKEIAEYFNYQTSGLRGIDVGSGSGRSTEILERGLNCNVDATDLSLDGLINTGTENKTAADALKLPYANNSFDFANMCGVMTNIVGESPQESLAARREAIREMRRVIKPGGLITISDFSCEHDLCDYMVNYARHALITGEPGTIAVFKPEAGVTFLGKTDEEVASLRNSPDLVRFAHHYSPKEIVCLMKEMGLNVIGYKVEKGNTPSGKQIENLIVMAAKPATVIE